MNDKAAKRTVAVVTGGGKGIGSAVCRALTKDGSSVVINYMSSSNEAATLCEELRAINPNTMAYQADVTDFSQMKKMMDEMVALFGRVDILVNNAGLARDGLLLLMPEKDWMDVMDVNLTGVFNASKSVLPHMIAQRSGVIINISSLSGIDGLAGQANYAAAKGGVIALTRALSKELAQFGIRVNAVAPGAIETDMLDAMKDTAREELRRNIPLRRFGRPEEVASVVRFLASEEAGYITGEVISVTGGL
ncbi:beta-ketoacyl-ACP reductase [Candidatus Magnetominusculus dajiuhuensis]|uniref:beta-ketoacyl-ACP reductase n=1 Tax=Candidatus Magnetominusculus dajiuhuensis TaxID=3137712 RepID=UPI003B42D874